MENKNVLNGVLFYSSGGKGGAINIVGKEDDEVKFPGKLAENLNVNIYKDKYPEASEADIPKIKMTGEYSFESEVCKGIFVPILNENISVVMHITLDNSTLEFESVGKFIAGLSKMSGSSFLFSELGMAKCLQIQFLLNIVFPYRIRGCDVHSTYTQAVVFH